LKWRRGRDLNPRAPRGAVGLPRPQREPETEGLEPTALDRSATPAPIPLGR
jgi:hypothetical protein